MASVRTLEATRLDLQVRLDAGKTSTERNKLGQFATPTPLAVDILEYAQSLLPPRTKIRFMDPAFGTGSFYSALLQVFPAARIEQALGFEIDPHYGDEAVHLWNDTSLILHLTDFTRVPAPTAEQDKATLVICNPPYVRHHHLLSSEKVRLQDAAQRLIGIRPSGLTGLYCYFLCLSQAWMAKDGLAGWLVPSEFMDVNYGTAIKSFLLNHVTLLRVHRFNPNDVQFEDALVSSAVVWFRNTPPPKGHSVEFTYGGSLMQPDTTRKVSVATLRSSTKWTKFPLSNGDAVSSTRTLKLSNLFTIKRGIATGANEFFMLTPEQIAEHQLPGEFLKPILPSPRYLPVNEVESGKNGHPLIERRLFLLSCGLQESKVKSQYPSLWKYLQSGVEAGINERYLCQHRSPWYSQEERPASPFLCTYMGRQRENGQPFRFLLNRSKATAPNVYLMLYPKPTLARILKDRPELVREIWQSLNEIPMEHLIGEGRVYGGGLHKMEPKELGNAPADGILALLPELRDECVEQIKLF